MENIVKLKDLVGRHILSAIEENVKTEIDYGYDVCETEGILLTLDGVNYMIKGDPDDGYRSYCSGYVAKIEKKPAYSLGKIIVDVSYICNIENFTGLLFKDTFNGEIILKIGTDYSMDDYYPFCVFDWKPHLLSVNTNTKEEEV